MLKILGRPSSINVRKVLWTCGEIGLPFELEPWGAGVRSTDDPAFLALNPNALVPVLVETDDAGDFVLWESNTICRYLALKHDRTDLLPAEPRDRARVEQWMDWQAGELNNAWRYAFMSLVRQSAAHRDAAQVATSAASWNRHMAMLEAQLQRTGAHVAGPTFTLADVLLGLATHRWLNTPIERPALPTVERWYRTLAGRAAFVAQRLGEHP